MDALEAVAEFADLVVASDVDGQASDFTLRQLVRDQLETTKARRHVIDHEQAGRCEEQQAASCNRKGQDLLVRGDHLLRLHRVLGLRRQPRHDLVEQVGRWSIHATYDLVRRLEIEAASDIRVVGLLVLLAESFVPHHEFGQKPNRRPVLQL